MSKLQKQLNVQLIKIDGKRCELTPIGRNLLQKVSPLLDDFEYLEKSATHLSNGVEAKISIKIDNIFPKDILFRAISFFNEKYPLTVLDINDQLRLMPSDDLDFDLAITTSENGLIPGSKIFDVSLIPVAHHKHPIFQLQTTILSHEQLSGYKQIFYERISSIDPEIINTDPRKYWSVYSVDAAIAAVKANLCFGWLPEHNVLDLLKSGELKKINIEDDNECDIPLYLIDNTHKIRGPATSYLKNLLLEVAQHYRTNASIQILD